MTETVFYRAAERLAAEQRRRERCEFHGACEAITDVDGTHDDERKFAKWFQPRAAERAKFDTGDSYWMSCYSRGWERYNDLSRILALLLMDQIERTENETH